MKLKYGSNDNCYLTYRREHFHLHVPQTASQRKVGLLNCVNLSKRCGLIYKNTCFFHTFGMKFSIYALPFSPMDENAVPRLVPPQRIFYLSRRFSKMIELSAENEWGFGEDSPVKILSPFLSKFVFHVIGFMKFILLFLLFFFCFKAACAQESSQPDPSSMLLSLMNAEKTLHIPVGGSKTIKLPAAPSSIDNSSPDNVQLIRLLNSNKVRILGVQRGKSSVSFLFPDRDKVSYAVQVDSKTTANNFSSIFPINPANPYLGEVYRQVKKISGMHPVLQNNKIVLHGFMRDMESFRTVSKIVLSHPNVIYPGYFLSQNIETETLHFVNTTIRNLNETDLGIKNVNGTFVLQGVASTPYQRDRIWKYVSQVLPNVTDNIASLYGQSRMVQVNMRFYEVSKSHKNENGLRNILQDGYGGQIQTTNDGGFLSRPLFQLAPFSAMMRYLDSQSDVKMLAKPVLLTRSGETAHFLAGGEIPIPSQHDSYARTTSDTSFKSYGIIFNVHPTVVGEKKIWLDLNLEVSLPQSSFTINHVPSFETKKISTNVLMDNGKAVLLSGLVQNNKEWGQQGVPVLQNIPILGSLFRSKEFTNHNSELYILISAALDPNSFQKEGNDFDKKSHERDDLFARMQNLLETRS